MEVLRDLQLQIQEVLDGKNCNDEYFLISLSSITKTWNICLREEFLKGFWRSLIEDESMILEQIFVSVPERVLWSTFSMLCRLTLKLQDVISRECDRSLIDKIETILTLPTREEFYKLIMRSFVIAIFESTEVFVYQNDLEKEASSDISNVFAVNDSPHSQNLRYIVETMSGESMKVFLNEFLDYIAIIETPNIRTRILLQVIWMNFSESKCTQMLLGSLRIIDSKKNTVAIKLFLETIFFKLCSSLALVFPECIIGFILKHPISSSLIILICESMPPSALTMLHNQVLDTWISSKFINTSSPATYQCVCDLLQICTSHQIIKSSPANRGVFIDQIQMTLLEGLSTVVDVQSEKLPMALQMLQQICKSIKPFICDNFDVNMTSLSALESLVQSLLSVVSNSCKTLNQKHCSTETEIQTTSHLSSSTPQESIPKKSFIQIIDELKDCAALGAESKFHTSQVLVSLESIIRSSYNAPGFLSYLSDIFHALLIIQNVEGLDDFDQEIQRLIKISVQYVPSESLQVLTEMLHVIIPDGTKYSTVDIAFSIKLLTTIEESVLYIEQQSNQHTPSAKSLNGMKTIIDKSDKKGRIKIKRPTKLALLLGEEKKTNEDYSHKEQFISVLISGIPNDILEGVWSLVKYCQQQIVPESSSISSDSFANMKLSVGPNRSERKYLIEEISANEGSKDINKTSFDFANSILLAQSLRTMATTLLCLSRSSYVLPSVIESSFHWSMQIVCFILDLASSTSFETLSHTMSLRRSLFGALLTAVERLTRAQLGDQELKNQEVHDVLEKVLVLAERVMDAEKDVTCQKILVQTIGMIIMSPP